MQLGDIRVMATFPDICYYSTSFAVAPEVVRTQYHSFNTRQRQLWKKRDDLFSVTLRLDTVDFNTLDSFIINDLNNGADEFTGPYYDSDVESTGTLQIVDGTYSASLLAPDVWEISYTFEVKNRDMTDADSVYDLVNGNGGFDGLNDLFNALEILVNENILIP